MSDCIDILAATIPDDINLDDDKAVAEHICNIAGVAGYSLSQIAKHIDAITLRADELRKERADV